MTDNKELKPSGEGNVEGRYPQLRELEEALTYRDSWNLWKQQHDESAVRKTLTQKAQEARQEVIEEIRDCANRTFSRGCSMSGAFVLDVLNKDLDRLTDSGKEKEE